MKRIFLKISAVFLVLSWCGLFPPPPALSGDARTRAVVVLDPGHGGRDTGVTAGARAEKDLSLELAGKIRDALGARYTVVLTRDKDIFLSPGERAGAANHAGASLFVSLHFSPRGGAAQYADVFSWSTTAPEKPGAFHLPALRAWDGLQRPHAAQSREMARILAAQLNKELTAAPPRTASFPLAVLKGVDAPAVVLDLPLGIFRGREAAGNMEGAARAVTQAVIEFFSEEARDKESN